MDLQKKKKKLGRGEKRGGEGRGGIENAWHQANHIKLCRPQSFQFAEPLWTDPGVKSGISVRELISTSEEKRKKAQAGI